MSAALKTATEVRHRRTPSVSTEQSDDVDGKEQAPLLNTSLHPSAPKLDKSGLYDLQQVKRVLDDHVISTLEDRGYLENTIIADIKIVVGAVSVAAALYSHFNGQEFPQNKSLIALCVGIYTVCAGIIYFLTRFTEGNAFFVGKLAPASKRALHVINMAPQVWAHSTLSVKGSSMYILQLRDAVNEKTSRFCTLNKPYEMYFAENGVLAALEFRNDIEKLLADLTNKRSQDDN